MARQFTRSTLAPWQKEDARRIKDLLKQARTRPDWTSQADFAAAYGLGSQSMLSQYAAGLRPLNFEAALAFAKGLHVSVERISPTFAKRLADAAPAYDSGSPPPAPLEQNTISALDRAMIGSFRSLDPTVRESIRAMINAVATAKSGDYAKWVRDIDAHNHKRDSQPRKKTRKTSRNSEE